jgi:hypothetical protein
MRTPLSVVRLFYNPEKALHVAFYPRKKQLTAGSPFADRMKVQLLSVAGDHLLADSAMQPIAPRPTRPAALLRLAGKSPRRCPALLNAPSRAHSGASNWFF